MPMNFRISVDKLSNLIQRSHNLTDKTMARAVSAAASKTGGDDLDDDLLISSGAEDDKLEAVDNGGAFEEDGLVRSPPAKVDEASSSAEEPGTGSRKRRASTEASEDEANRKAEKKRRKKEKEKLRKAKVSFCCCRSTVRAYMGRCLTWQQKQDGIAASLSLTPPTHCTPSEISELLLASIGETFPAASPLEIDDLIIPGQPLTNLRNPSGWLLDIEG